MECLGHIQKRVGARLRKLKATNKSLLSDGKRLGGVGRLTDKKINKLQNYFGIAILQCCGTSVYELKKAIGAVLFHCSEASSSELLILGANFKKTNLIKQMFIKKNQDCLLLLGT